MISGFGELKKKEQSNEFHKRSLRKKMKGIKERYIGSGKRKITQSEYPKMSELEFKVFKDKWAKKRKTEIINNIIIISLVFILAILFALYLYN